MLKQYFRANPRVAGLVLTIISLVMGKFFMLDVVTAAQAHSDNVTLSLKVVVMSIAIFVTGVILFVTGPIGGSLLYKAPGARALPPLGYVLVTVIVAVSFGGYFLFKQYVESFGYKF